MSKTAVLCRTAMTAALCFILTLLSVKIGNLHISFGSLPIVVSALLFGPLEAASAAFTAEFLNQLLTYGLTITTPLWLIPPVLRALIIGLAARRFKARSGKCPEDAPVFLFLTCILSAVIVTVTNTAGIYLDSLIFGYYTFVYVFGSFFIRLLTGIITAAAIAAVSMPLIRLLRRVPALAGR